MKKKYDATAKRARLTFSFENLVLFGQMKFIDYGLHESRVIPKIYTNEPTFY